MKGGSLATWAELFELKTVWVVTTVLLGDVVALFAVDAGHGDLWTNVRALACHGLAPSPIEMLLIKRRKNSRRGYWRRNPSLSRGWRSTDKREMDSSGALKIEVPHPRNQKGRYDFPPDWSPA